SSRRRHTMSKRDWSSDVCSSDLFHVMGLKESFKMEAKEFQKWIAEYYKSRGWSDLDIFVRIGFLSEETGEVARAIRSLEIGRDRPDEHTASLAESKR